MNPIDRLIALEDIRLLKARYFRFMDTKDWGSFRTLFVENVSIDTTEAFTPRDALGRRIEANLPVRAPNPTFSFVGIDAFIAAQHEHLDGVSTIHHGHTPEIDFISDDVATGIWAMEDRLRWPVGRGPMRTMHGYGHYRETYHRIGGNWRIAALKLTRIRIDVEAQTPAVIWAGCDGLVPVT